MNEILKNRENVSALADGHVQGEALIAVVDIAISDADARATWHAYHVVGDVLRSTDLAPTGHQTDFMTRFQARLKAEPPLMMVPSVVMPASSPVALATVVDAYGAAANASVFRWKMVAGCASLAAAAVIGWSLMGSVLGGSSAHETLATLPTPSTLTAVNLPSIGEPDAPLLMIRDTHLDALLAAHKQVGGTSALQAPSGFLRNATFDVTGR